MLLRFLLPGIYLALCFTAWVSFMSLPPDGLANLGIMLLTLPLSLLWALADNIGIDPFGWLHLGYYDGQTVQFAISAAVISWGLFHAGRWLDGRVRG